MKNKKLENKNYGYKCDMTKYIVYKLNKLVNNMIKLITKQSKLIKVLDINLTR